jgi:hypothetical protein
LEKSRYLFFKSALGIILSRLITEALNLKSNNKNKHNIILSIGEDKITRNAAKALFDKHPNTSVLVTLDEQGELVFPEGKAFTPDSSVRVNIVGHSEALEQVGATKLADYTDQLVQHYKIDLVGNHAYLNRDPYHSWF